MHPSPESPRKNYLAELPSELIVLICRHLINQDLLRLGIAWKYFLCTFTPSFDPWNERRMRLKKECKAAVIFAMVLQLRFTTQKKDWFKPSGFKPSTFAALLDFAELDWNSVVKVHRLRLIEPSYDHVLNLLASRSERTETGPGWGRGILNSRLTWKFALDHRFDDWLDKICWMVGTSDWISVLSLWLRDSKSITPGREELWRKGLTALAGALAESETLRELWLACKCSGKTFTLSKEEVSGLLAPSLRLKTLSIDNILLPPAEELRHCLRGGLPTRLVRFQLHHCKLDSAQASILLDALGNLTCLQELELDYDSLDDDSAVAVAEMLKTNKSLAHVNLSWNQFGDRGMRALIEMLVQNTTLKSVILHRSEDDFEYAVMLRDCVEDRGWTFEAVFQEGEVAMIRIPELDRSVEMYAYLSEWAFPTDSEDEESISAKDGSVDETASLQEDEFEKFLEVQNVFLGVAEDLHDTMIRESNERDNETEN